MPQQALQPGGQRSMQRQVCVCRRGLSAANHGAQACTLESCMQPRQAVQLLSYASERLRAAAGRALAVCYKLQLQLPHRIVLMRQQAAAAASWRQPSYARLLPLAAVLLLHQQQAAAGGVGASKPAGRQNMR